MPFIRTAYIPRQTDEPIMHFNAVRLRVVGNGMLKLTLYSLQDEQRELLADLPLAERTNIQPTRLANFKDQRVSLELKTVSINDYMRVNRIIIYSREFASEYPS